MQSGKQKVEEAGRLVAEAFSEADDSGNPFARAALTQAMAEANLMLLSAAREHIRGSWANVR